MKFGPDGEPLQVESRAFALYLFPWLAAVLIVAGAGVLYLADAPPSAVMATEGTLSIAILGAQLYFNRVLRRYLTRG